MDLAIGIDVGFSATRRLTGVVIIDRSTKGIAAGSTPTVSTGSGALTIVSSEIARLRPKTVTFCVDGPFAPGQGGAKVRLAERFFMSGPFGSTPPPRGLGLRISPAPTGSGSTFLASTLVTVNALVALGFRHMTVAPQHVDGDIIEIFPTLFMAALLPPHAYVGRRNSHSDQKWLTLIGPASVAGFTAIHPALAPYQAVVAAVEGSAGRDLHDLRTAAISAIAADWYATAPPGSRNQNRTVFVGHPTEYGFILPPRGLCDPGFLSLMGAHRKIAGGQPLVWI